MPRAKFDKDPNAIRTVLISGLPTSIDQKTLWKKVRKLEGAESVHIDENGEGNSVTGASARSSYLFRIERRSSTYFSLFLAQAIFVTPASAAHAVEKLHAHIFKGALLSVTLKKRIEGLAKPKTKTPGQPNAQNDSEGAPTPNRASRLIVRNVPWDVRAILIRFLSVSIEIFTHYIRINLLHR